MKKKKKQAIKNKLILKALQNEEERCFSFIDIFFPFREIQVFSII